MTARQAKMQHEICEALLRIASDRVDRLNALMHIVAADLQAAKFSPEEVVGYLCKITGMPDGKFDRGPAPAPVGRDVRYGGRTIKMDVLVNTDAPIEDCRGQDPGRCPGRADGYGDGLG